MEASPLPQNLTLNPSETTYSFPSHRRRPLRSRTCSALIRILSHCRTTFPHLPTQVSDDDGSVTRKDGNSTGVLLPLSDSKGSKNTIVQETSNDENKENNSMGVLVPLPDSKGSKNMIVQETSNNENKKNTGNGDFDGKQATIPKLHQVDLVADGEQEMTPSSRINLEDFLVVENHTDDCAIQKAKELENVNSVLDIQIDDFEMDKEFCISHFDEVLESCFGMDMVFESPKAGQDSREKDAVLENLPKDAEHELQLKKTELEKLIHNSGGLESSSRHCLGADEDIEEGEISGEAGVACEPFDVLSDDAASLGEITTEKMHASEGYFDVGELFSRYEGSEMSDAPLVYKVNSDSSSMKMENRPPAGQMQDSDPQNVFCDSRLETQHCSDLTPCLQNSTPSGTTAAEDHISFTTKKDDDDGSKKKRKRGPLTKEKRAKKKKKERLKRAEKNRELGVKRLKLQPVLKPKKIVYCRHYLQGRCHEGEKCNFSHDTVPLTKSKPCGHFARHSCMKGDKCPFDHELSKYPCKNYASTGFCSRGSECLFSHEMPANSCSMTPNISKPDLMPAQHTLSDKGGSNPISKFMKPELKFPSPLNISNSSKLMDNHGVLHQNANAKFCSSPNSPVQSAEHLAAKPVQRTGRQIPKGVSFLVKGGTSPVDTTDRRDGSCMKTPDGVGVSCKAIPEVPRDVNNLNGMSEGLAPRKPRGINFLSFGQSTADDSSSRIFSSLLSNCNNGTVKSVVDDMGKGKRICSMPCGGILESNKQMSRRASGLASDMNENVDGTSLSLPSHVKKFSSFNRIHLDDSNSKETANIHFNKGNTTLPFLKEGQGTSKLQHASKTSSLSFGGLWDQSTGGLSANLASSFQKPLFLNTPSLVQKTVQSTLAFAAKFESDIRVGSSLHQ